MLGCVVAAAALRPRPAPLRARPAGCSCCVYFASRPADRDRLARDRRRPRAARSSRGSATRSRDWIDRAVGRDADVAVVWTGKHRPLHAIWENEFFNRSVGPVYDTRRGRCRAACPRPPSRSTRDTRLRRGADGSAVAAPLRRSPTARSSWTAIVVAADELHGVAALPGRRPAALDDERDGALPERHVVGADASLHGASGCTRRHARGRRSAATRRCSRSRRRSSPADADGDALASITLHAAARRSSCACRSGRRTTSARVRFTVAPTAVPGRTATLRGARRPLPRASTYQRP